MSTVEIVQSIDEKLAALRSEMKLLEEARGHLVGGNDSQPVATTPKPRRRSRSRRRPNGQATSTRSRARAGGTQHKILQTLQASATPLTAQDVATATGLGRASVSTTMSKLARAGRIEKADRGYTCNA